MKWYWDTSHHKSALGDQILERIFTRVDSSFGQLLTESNIDQWLLSARSNQSKYMWDHPVDVMEVRELVTPDIKSQHR